MPSRSSKSRNDSLSKHTALGELARFERNTKSTIKSARSASNEPPNNFSPPSSITRAPEPTPTPIPPQNWPISLPYLTHPIFSPYLPHSHLKWLHARPQTSTTTSDDNHTSDSSTHLALPVISFPLLRNDIDSRVEIRLIDDPGHPACGQRGLFAARDLLPRELVVVYLGYVHGGTEAERKEFERTRERERELHLVKSSRDGRRERDSNPGCDDPRAGMITGGTDKPSPSLEVRLPATSQSNGTDCSDVDGGQAAMSGTSMIGSWDTSSYDLNMYRDQDIEIAVDAANMGNEARFVNDYRGVPISISMSNSTRGTDQIKNGRKAKRKVKVKVVDLTPYGPQELSSGSVEEDPQRRSAVEEKAETGDGEGDGIDWQKEWHHYHNKDNSNISMPNAEFRDVWFDIPDNVDLNLSSSLDSECSITNIAGKAEASASVSAPAPSSQVPHLHIHTDPTAQTNKAPSETDTNPDNHPPTATIPSLDTPQLTSPSPCPLPFSSVSTFTSIEEPQPNYPKSTSLPLPPRIRKRNPRSKPGIRGVAIYVMPAGKSGKRKGGIKMGQEVLVSYGKGFWAHHG